MILFILTRSLSTGIAASIVLNIFTDLAPGAISGLIAGLVVGAAIVPLIQVPDALGKSLLFAALFGVAMMGYQLVRVLSVTGGSMGSILNALDSPLVGQAILNAVLYTLYAILGGILLGVLLTVPDKAIKGGLIGMLFGVMMGTVLYWLFGTFGIYMNQTLFRLLTGLLVFGVLTAVAGKN